MQGGCTAEVWFSPTLTPLESGQGEQKACRPEAGGEDGFPWKKEREGPVAVKVIIGLAV